MRRGHAGDRAGAQGRADRQPAGPGEVARQDPRTDLSAGPGRYPEPRADDPTTASPSSPVAVLSALCWWRPAPSARRRRRRAPRPRESTPPPPPKATQIIMAIDSIGAGLQPAPAVRPVAGERRDLLAGAAEFVPADRRSGRPPTGSRWELDPTLLVSAEVTSEEPFTVTYKIRPEAQWTDNAPIAADDYWYLWRQMVSAARRRRPGGLRPDHRRAVGRGRQDRGGHLLAALPGLAGAVQRHPARAHRQGRAGRVRARDWPGRCRSPAASSASTSIDPQRDEILLARNDRYWGRARQARSDPVPARREHPPHLPTRSATATPRSPRCTAGRRRSRSSSRSPTCAPRASSRRG